MKYLLFTLALMLGGAAQAALPLISVNGHLLGANGKPITASATAPPSGGVTWLDPLSYAKPQYYAWPEPDEPSSPHYYVDQSAGSGSTCSQIAPCATINAVAGKSGTSGGPAYIYVKGNGTLSLTASTLFGGSGTEIVIKPWPSDSTPTVWTAPGGCGTNNANFIAGASTHDIIFDGGPSQLFTLKGSGCTTSQNGYTAVIQSNQITLYRLGIDTNASAGPSLGIATNDGVFTQNTNIVNVEIYNAGKYYGIYVGGGSSCPGGTNHFSNLTVINSLFRNIDGRGIQIEPRAASSGFKVIGSAFHDIGYDRSGGSSISGAVQVADACSAETSSVLVASNLMFDLGGGGVLNFEAPATDADFLAYNNTIYNYANSAQPASTNSHGMVGCFSGSCNGTFINNIVLAPAQGGLDPLHNIGGTVTATNSCPSATSCGSTAVSSTTAVFQSTSTASANFLKLNASSILSDAGTTETLASPDYAGVARPVGSAYSIGAFEN